MGGGGNDSFPHPLTHRRQNQQVLYVLHCSTHSSDFPWHEEPSFPLDTGKTAFLWSASGCLSFSLHQEFYTWIVGRSFRVSRAAYTFQWFWPNLSTFKQNIHIWSANHCACVLCPIVPRAALGNTIGQPGCISQKQLWLQVPSLPIEFNGTNDHS